MTEENKALNQPRKDGNQSQEPPEQTQEQTSAEARNQTPEQASAEAGADEELSRVTADLQAALAAAREQAKSQSDRIAELEANYLTIFKEAEQLKAARTASDAESSAKTADLEELKARNRQIQAEYGQAIAALIELHRAANPDIPAELITGSTIAEVTESVARARDLVKKIRDLAGAEAARIPAGAPGRQQPGVDGLSPREKITLGIKKKGV